MKVSNAQIDSKFSQCGLMQFCTYQSAKWKPSNAQRRAGLHLSYLAQGFHSWPVTTSPFLSLPAQNKHRHEAAKTSILHIQKQPFTLNPFKADDDFLTES